MIRLYKLYVLEIDKMKITQLVSIFCAVFLLYMFLLSFGIYGPARKVIEPVSFRWCENHLEYIPGEKNKINEPTDYNCVICKIFRAQDRIQTLNLNIDLYPSQDAEQNFEDLGFQFHVSTLGSNDINSKCDDIAQTTSLKEFPIINNDKLTNYNTEHPGKTWKLINNNDLMNGVTECVPGLEPKCTIKVLDDVELDSFYTKFGMAVRLSLTEAQKAKIHNVNFELIFENDRFVMFTLIFQILFIGASLLCFIRLFRKLKDYDMSDWLDLHKWILALLLAQFLLDDPFSLFNFVFQNKIFNLLSELGKTAHLVILFYFWISVFDKILIENIPYGWLSRWSERIKILLLTSIFLLESVSQIYIQFKEYENEYEDLFSHEDLIQTIQSILKALQILYCIYFLGLVFFYVKMINSGEIQVNKTSQVLFGFTFLMFVVVALYLFANHISEGVFEFMAVQGLVTLYTIIISFLYAPRKIESSDQTDVHFSNKKGENVYQMENLGDDDDEDEEEKEQGEDN